MEFKEYSFDPEIRLCVYNVGRENLEFHRHSHIADITYCASGRLRLELPELNKSYIFYPGQTIQVPCNTIHRVSHCDADADYSRYILIQIGRFSIDFVKDAVCTNGEQAIDLRGKNWDFFIDESLNRLRNITAKFLADRPHDLTHSEYTDMQKALNTVCSKGVKHRPTTGAILRQLAALES